MEMIDERIERGRTPPAVVADAGYRDTTAFRRRQPSAISHRGTVMLEMADHFLLHSLRRAYQGKRPTNPKV